MPAVGPGGTGVGRYRYIAMLAEGGMADVYLAVTKGQANFEKLVVIKELRAALAQDPTFVQMFLDEARLAARLNHPNVVQTYEVGSEGSRHFIAMELLEGVPYVRLTRLRDRIPPPLAIHVRILADVLYGLHYAHELVDYDGKPLSVVHRDVSPQNVMLTFAGGVKLLDFGIAKAALSVEQRPDDFKGKLAYMAPEQALLEDVDRRADIFSVGVMLWEAVARRRLWENVPDKYERLVAGELPELLRVRPDASKRLANVCERALARDPDARYQTAAEMANDLEEWLDGTTQHVSSRDTGVYISEKFARAREKLAAAIAAQVEAFREQPELGTDTQPLPRIAAPDLAAPTDEEAAPRVDEIVAPIAAAAWASEPPLPRPSGTPAAIPRTTAPPSPSSSALFGAAVATVVVLVLLLGGALGVLALRRSSRPAAAAAAPIGAEGDKAGSAPPVDPHDEIDLTVKARPSEARIFVDGQPERGNPVTGRRKRDGAMHVVRVEAKGYEPREEQLAFDRSLVLTFDLRPIATAEPAPPPPAQPAPPPPAPPPAPDVKPARQARPPPAPARYVRPPPRPASNLDTENPYQ
jgi:serine/threonine-protein kinase